MSESKKELLVVLDLETTGLCPERDEILEIAFIVVDNETLDTLGSYESIVRPAALDLMRLSDAVIDMHSKNGLLTLARSAQLDVQDVQSEALEALSRIVGQDANGHLRTDIRLILTGNTVHFDRSFLQVHMPRLALPLYHRHADVSAARTVLGAKAPGVDVAHRAMADCEMSLAELKALRAAFNAKGLN